MIQKPFPSVSGGVQLPLFDESELDIADYLREEADPPPPAPQGFAALTLGAVGVVYGDIGTSPIYAFREALRPISGDGLARGEVLGLLSIIIWTLTLIVTVKYVLFLLRTDNRGGPGAATSGVCAPSPRGSPPRYFSDNSTSRA